MAEAWHDRLRVWKEDVEAKLARKWWLWPILLIFALVWHALLSAINEFIGAHRKSMYNAVKVIVSHIPSDAVSVTVIIAILVVSFLIVHSYFDTRKKPRVEATVKLTPLDIYFERSTNPKIVYKSKMRIVLRNDTGQDINVHVPNWIAESDDVPIQWPPASTLQIEGTEGWDKDNWQAESKQLNIPVNKVFRAWIGLNPEVNADELRRRHETRRLGVFALPVNISGREEQFTTRL